MNQFTPATTSQSAVPGPYGRPGGATLDSLRGELMEEESFFGDLGQVVRRRGGLIALVAVATVAIVGAVTVMTPSEYTASASLLIDKATPQVVDIESVLADLSDDDFYETQYEILTSRSLAAEVLRDDDLAASLSSDEAVLAAEGPELDADGAFFERGVSSELIDDYLEKLAVSRVGKSRMVRLEFTALDPQLAARVANAHARGYIAQGMSLRREASNSARGFLEVRLVDLKQRLERSETALNDYRRSEGIVSLDAGENLVVGQLAALHSQLTNSEAERISVEAQYQLVRGRDFASIPEVQASELIGDLKRELSAYEAQQADLVAQFQPGRGPKGELAQLAARIAQTRAQLEAEQASIVGSIESAYLVAKARERDLRTRVEAQKTAALALKDASVEYAILAREVDANRELYQSVLQRLKEIGVTSELHATNVFVIDEAHPPREASAPDRGQALALALILGLVGGLGLAYGVEQFDTTLRSAPELEALLDIPCLASVPDLGQLAAATLERRDAEQGGVRRLLPFTGSRKLALPPNRSTAGLDAFRAIRTGILLSRADEPPRTILFTSAVRGEGKTATLLSTALAFAQTGGRVLVIDADLRRPRCNRALGGQPGMGLTEVLAGHADAEPLIQRAENSPLFFLPAGSIPPNPTELLGSETMRETLLDLRTRYHYVLIDAPPILNISDAIVLSTLVDGVVLVVDQQSTPRQLIREAHSKLVFARAPILGAVLNRADLRTISYDPYGQELAA